VPLCFVQSSHSAVSVAALLPKSCFAQEGGRESAAGCGGESGAPAAALIPCARSSVYAAVGELYGARRGSAKTKP
jgi:hypothetical protein